MSTFLYTRASFDPKNQEGSVEAQKTVGLEYLACQGVLRDRLLDSMKREGKSQAQIDEALAKFPDREPVCKRLWNGQPFDPIVVENNCSAKLDLKERPSGGIMYHLLQPGDHVVVVRLDRLCRRFPEFVKLWEHWTQMGVTIHVVRFAAGFSGALDANNPVTKLLVYILEAFAEFEKALIRERTCEGKRRQKESGKRMSQYPGPGMKFVKERLGQREWAWMCRPDPEERRLIMRMLQWNEGGYSIEKIWKYLRDLEWTDENGVVQRGVRRQALRLKKNATKTNGHYSVNDYVDDPKHYVKWTYGMVEKAVGAAREWVRLGQEAEQKPEPEPPKENVDANPDDRGQRVQAQPVG